MGGTHNFPRTDIFSHVEVANGHVWMLPHGVESFAGDLSEEEKKLVWATHYPPAADLFNGRIEEAAWRSKPSWYIIGKKDHTVHPELQRVFTKRMGATVYEADSSHVPMLSNPKLVLDVIRAAAKAAQGSEIERDFLVGLAHNLASEVDRPPRGARRR